MMIGLVIFEIFVLFFCLEFGFHHHRFERGVQGHLFSFPLLFEGYSFGTGADICNTAKQTHLIGATSKGQRESSYGRGGNSSTGRS